MAKQKVTPLQEMLLAIETAMHDLTSAVAKDRKAQKKLLKKSKPFMSKLSKLIKKAEKRARENEQAQSTKSPTHREV